MFVLDKWMFVKFILRVSDPFGETMVLNASATPRQRRSKGSSSGVYTVHEPTYNSASFAVRGYSSAGRALAWHARGQRFDPAYLHQRK